MNFAKRNKSVIDFFFILTLFAAFAVLALLVVVFGARVYEGIVKNSETNFSSRSAYYYISQKIHAYDRAGSVDIATVGEYNAIALTNKVGDGSYITYIYPAANTIREITVPDDYAFAYGDGDSILEVLEFEVSITDDKLLHVHILDLNNEITDFYIAVNSKIGGSYED